MPAWTPAERRGALLVVVLLSLGAAHDLWRATHPRWTAAPPAAESVAAPPAADATSPGPTWAGSPARAFLVDLNRAGPAELDALPGIGPVLAGRIIQHRSLHGPFHQPEELLAVPGIGPRLFARLRPLVAARIDSTGTPRPARDRPSPDSVPPAWHAAAPAGARPAH